MMKYIPYVLLFALATALIYGWGVIKTQNQSSQMLAMLYRKCEKKLLKALKEQQYMTVAQVENLLKGTKVSLFYSRNKLMVTNPQLFAKSVLEKLQGEGRILQTESHGKKVFTLAERAEK